MQSGDAVQVFGGSLREDGFKIDLRIFLRPLFRKKNTGCLRRIRRQDSTGGVGKLH